MYLLKILTQNRQFAKNKRLIYAAFLRMLLVR